MDFRLSPEQKMLKDSAENFAKDYLGRQRALSQSEPRGFSQDCWREIVELGWLAAGLPESAGGFGGTAIEAMLVHEAVGAGLIVEPLLPAELAARLIDLAGSDEQREALLPALLVGKNLITIAHFEDASRGDPGYIESKAMRTSEGWVLAGCKTLVPWASCADYLIISARFDGQDSIGLFVIPQERLAGRLKACETIDGLYAADVSLDGMQVYPADALGPQDRNLEALIEVFDHAVILGCAEAVGIMDAVLALTAEYLNARRQFGAPIASFQALQHKLADMVIATELARSILLSGVAALSAEDPNQRRRVVSSAKVRITESARLVGGQGIQLHGAIGITEEYILSHYYRRLVTFASRFGGIDFHLERFAAGL
jgi:alkylation response protein AidB-like acyl-CoA dehydrogenase